MRPLVYRYPNTPQPEASHRWHPTRGPRPPLAASAPKPRTGPPFPPSLIILVVRVTTSDAGTCTVSVPFEEFSTKFLYWWLFVLCRVFFFAHDHSTLKDPEPPPPGGGSSWALDGWVLARHPPPSPGLEKKASLPNGHSPSVPQASQGKGGPRVTKDFTEVQKGKYRCTFNQIGAAGRPSQPLQRNLFFMKMNPCSEPKVYKKGIKIIYVRIERHLVVLVMKVFFFAITILVPRTD